MEVLWGGEQLWGDRMGSSIWEMNLMNPRDIQKKHWTVSWMHEPKAWERALGWRGQVERLLYPHLSRGFVWGHPGKAHSGEGKSVQGRMRNATFWDHWGNGVCKGDISDLFFICCFFFFYHVAENILSMYFLCICSSVSLEQTKAHKVLGNFYKPGNHVV